MKIIKLGKNWKAVPFAKGRAGRYRLLRKDEYRGTVDVASKKHTPCPNRFDLDGSFKLMALELIKQVGT